MGCFISIHIAKCRGSGSKAVQLLKGWSSWDLKRAAANAYNWVRREDTKYFKVSNHLDDQISVCLACVTFSCIVWLKNKPSIRNVDVQM